MALINTNNNKAGISPVPTDRYVISSTDVVNYLQTNVLGFSIGYDFTRWTGASPDHSYVRMRTVFAPKDIVATTQSRDYIDKILAENSAGMQFKGDIIKSLEPFMYPKGIANIRNYPEEMNRLYQCGLFGDRLDEVIMNSQLTYAKEQNLFGLYLRPERIIADMLADPATNKIIGEMSIVGVHGTTSETIRWDVEVSRNNGFGTNANNISIDSIFTRTK